MPKKVQYKDDFEGLDINDLIPIPDFLPPPEVLAKAPINVKITIKLSLESLDYFKEQAAKHKVPYQRMIRNLLDEYVAHQQALESAAGDKGGKKRKSA